MYNISVEVKATPGSDIRDVLKECRNLAIRMSIPVDTKFNGITVHVTPDGDVDKGVEKYHYLGEHPEKFQHISI